MSITEDVGLGARQAMLQECTRLREPLIKANESERVGYPPNVVYTCGDLFQEDELIIILCDGRPRYWFGYCDAC